MSFPRAAWHLVATVMGTVAPFIYKPPCQGTYSLLWAGGRKSSLCQAARGREAPPKQLLGGLADKDEGSFG